MRPAVTVLLATAFVVVTVWSTSSAAPMADSVNPIPAQYNHHYRHHRTARHHNSNGSTLYGSGNFGYENNGTVYQPRGNETYIYRPNAPAEVCSTYGNHTICR
jgi:hypothetical protein